MKIKSVSVLLVLIIVSLCFVGCNTSVNETSTPSNNTETAEEKSTINHYEIDLNLENYWKYINWSQDFDECTFSGVLSFAYYENVIVTVERTISSPEYTTNTYSEKYDIELNAAGNLLHIKEEKTFDEYRQLLNVSGYMGSVSDKITVVGIKGKVIFSA